MKRYWNWITVWVLAFMVATPAAADNWRSDIGIFRVGLVVDNQKSGALNRAEPFRLALEQALDIEVEFFAARSTEGLIEAIRSDRIEYAILPASAYALTWKICECVEPVASPRSADSTDGYHAVLITRENLGGGLQDWADKQIATLTPDAFVQNRLFQKALEDASIDPDTTRFAHDGSGEKTLAAFLEGKHDALLGWSSLSGNPSEGYSRGTLRRIAQTAPQKLQSLGIVWKSKQIPHKVHFVRKKLPGESKNLVRDFLLGLFDRDPVAYDSIEPVYGGGFANTRQSRFEPLIELLETPEAPQPEADTDQPSETENTAG